MVTKQRNGANNIRRLLCCVLFLAVLITIPVAAEQSTAGEYPKLIVNVNGPVTIYNIILPSVEAKVYTLNESEVAARFSRPLTREEFFAVNRQYIDFLTEQFGKERAEKMANDEYDRATNGPALPGSSGTTTAPQPDPTEIPAPAPATKPAPLPGIISLVALGATTAMIMIRKTVRR
ncbi:MAG: hypothetical protein WCX22_00425 [Methanoregula sp.]